MSRDKRNKTPVYWEPDDLWLAEHKSNIRAIQAVWSGTANEGQQKNALAFILEHLCNRTGNQYYASERDSVFAMGKKFVGDHIAGAINAKLGQIKEPKNARSSTGKPVNRQRQ